MNANRLTTPKQKVQQLQEKLGHAAKENKNRKFQTSRSKGKSRFLEICNVICKKVPTIPIQ